MTWVGIKTVSIEMSGISSHRDQRGSKMRVLIFSAFLACAAAAPSGLLAPVVVPGVAYSAILPTISPGDIQAAAIDAQVKAQDQAIAAVDKARELSELAVENLNERAESSNDQVKEKVVEEFWSVEDKKWQALDAIKTAEAQIDGSIASNADALSKSAVASPAVISPYVALPNVAVAPIALSPIAYSPGIIAPEVKTVTEKEEKSEAVVKAAEASEDKDSVAVEAGNADEKIAEVKSEEVKPLPSVNAPYKYPIVAPISPSVLKFTAAVPYTVQTVGLAPQTVGLAPQTLGLAPQVVGLAPQTIGLAPTVYNTPIYNTVW